MKPLVISSQLFTIPLLYICITFGQPLLGAHVLFLMCSSFCHHINPILKSWRHLFDLVIVYSFILHCILIFYRCIEFFFVLTIMGIIHFYYNKPQSQKCSHNCNIQDLRYLWPHMFLHFLTLVAFLIGFRKINL